ncbi:syntaxin of plants SYP7 [Strigomonas culicis]|uniref:Syntaxin of plants SYP7 n=1 Tax=Strigomonas culicis TaxID=28005 RepID=S9WCF9_9TRYP|nr:syntaxin of plants SYP7 [Strigomonas culicis]|eukprot:EPY33750.1 syntaxin of plants SYP7 [Strigomonas culicis]
MLENDPFDEVVKELRESITQAKVIQGKAAQKGVVTADNVIELRNVHANATENLEMLREMTSAIENRGGRFEGKFFSANEMLNRQNTVRSLESGVTEIDLFIRDIEAKNKARAEVARKRDAYSPQAAKDDFVQTQEHAQREETELQDQVLDRLSYGLQELRETGVNINDELVVQDAMLNDIDRDMSGVQVRLRAANQKVDKLLASMSNKGKYAPSLASF